MNEPKPISFKGFLSPRFWPTWAGFGLLFIIAWLPLTVRLRVGALLGLISLLLGKERRYITQINIAKCFPELTEKEQQDLVKNIFRENGIGLIESTTGWLRKAEAFQHLLVLKGEEHFFSALEQGRGVVMLGAHYTTLDFTANLISLVIPYGTTYRARKNPLFDAFVHNARTRYCTGVFDRKNIRGIFRHLKQGKALWYAPDQDYGPDHSVFAPFFGQQAATITAASRFAEYNNSPVIMIRHHRAEDNKHYIVEFFPVLENLPSGDELKDARQINTKLEQAIRMAPAQYLWMHKRFKTQPEGKKQSPYIFIRNSPIRLRHDQIELMLQEATRHSSPEEYDLDLNDDLKIKFFPGKISRLQERYHPAVKFDRMSKELRSRGFLAPTVDNIFSDRSNPSSLLAFFSEEGEMLPEIEPDQLPLADLAIFLAKLHQSGFNILTADTLSLSEGKQLYVNARMLVLRRPFSICFDERIDTICTTAKELRINLEDFVEFTNFYIDASNLKSNTLFMAKFRQKSIEMNRQS